MLAPFDLLRTEADGTCRWLGACADLDAAKVRVAELSLTLPAKYFIFSQESGARFFINSDGTTTRLT